MVILLDDNDKKNLQKQIDVNYENISNANIKKANVDYVNRMMLIEEYTNDKLFPIYGMPDSEVYFPVISLKCREQGTGEKTMDNPYKIVPYNNKISFALIGDTFCDNRSIVFPSKNGITFTQSSTWLGFNGTTGEEAYEEDCIIDPSITTKGKIIMQGPSGTGAFKLSLISTDGEILRTINRVNYSSWFTPSKTIEKIRMRIEPNTTVNLYGRIVVGWTDGLDTTTGLNYSSFNKRKKITFDNFESPLYGGSIYLTNGFRCVSSYAYNELDGTEKITKMEDLTKENTYVYQLDDIESSIYSTNYGSLSYLVCSHFKTLGTVSSTTELGCALSSRKILIRTNISTVDEFKTWLSEQKTNGKPIGLAYFLNEIWSKTIDDDEPFTLNGSYSNSSNDSKSYSIIYSDIDPITFYYKRDMRNDIHIMSQNVDSLMENKEATKYIKTAEGWNISIDDALESRLSEIHVFGKTIITDGGLTHTDNGISGSGMFYITLQNENETIKVVMPYSSGVKLAAVPVDSGGNYIDENGQQWIADEIYTDMGYLVHWIERVKIIESYSGESITTSYISSTGDLSEGAQVYYVLPKENDYYFSMSNPFLDAKTYTSETTVTVNNGGYMRLMYFANPSTIIKKLEQKVDELLSK